jgi:hypothetical protein
MKMQIQKSYVCLGIIYTKFINGDMTAKIMKCFGP